VRALLSLGIAAVAAFAFMAEGLAMATSAAEKSSCPGETCGGNTVVAVLVPLVLSVPAFGAALVAATGHFERRPTWTTAGIGVFIALAAFEHWMFLT
jgi:hypothetical protein